MKILNREAIKRMVGQGAAAGGGTGGGGGGSVDLTGYATEAWVNENYLSIEFFSSLFKAYDSAATPNEITPNDGDTTAITNIKAMFGFWTEQYLSALSLNSAGGGGGDASSLDDLQDVNLSSLTNGQALVYNATSGKWENQTIGGGSTGTLSSIGLVMPAGFSVSPSTLTADGSFTVGFSSGYALPLVADVDKGVTAYGWGNHASAGYLTSSDLAGYATESWVGQEISDMATQTWVNLQGYLTPASLNGYATESWVNQQGFLTSSALNGYATQSWVGNNYLPLTGGTLTGDLRLKNSSNYGMHLYFGDGSCCYLYEDADGHLVIHAAKGVKFDLGTNYNATIGNDIIATQPWVSSNYPGTVTSVQVSATSPVVSSNSSAQSSSLSTTISLATAYGDTMNPYGSKTKNYVLAAPSDAAGTPSFRALVSDDIPDLSGTYATAARATTLEGYFTNGSAKTAIKLNTARSLWGNSFDGSADVTGAIKLLNGTGNGIYQKDISGTERKILGMDGGNPGALSLGLDMAGYGNTNIYGNTVALLGTNSVKFYVASTEIASIYRNTTNNVTYQGIRIGDALLSWDSTNDALKVQRYDGTAVNLYSLGSLSSLGLSAGANGSISKLTITEELKFDNSDFSHTIYDDGSGILHINASEGLEIGSDLMIPYNMVVANEMKSSKFYLDSTRYIYLDGTTLKYYNGSQSKTIVLS